MPKFYVEYQPRPKEMPSRAMQLHLARLRANKITPLSYFAIIEAEDDYDAMCYFIIDSCKRNHNSGLQDDIFRIGELD